MLAYYGVHLSVRSEPVQAHARVSAALRGAGGAILEATRLSNKALTFKVECYARTVPQLIEALGKLGTIVEAAEQPAGAAPLATLAGDTDVLLLLHVLLLHDLPDERVELPKVPG